MIAKLITVQGQARGGKGTIARALAADLAEQYKVVVIDQGQKFRVLADLAIKAGINPENLESLEAFIVLASTHQQMLVRLEEINSMTGQQIEERYYSEQINNASGMVGKISKTHDVVISVLLDEVRQLSQRFDFILIDGRALRKYGQGLEEEGVIEYMLAIDVMCSPMTAAKRLLGLPTTGDVDDLTSEQKSDLLRLINDIDRRNSSDARRQRDPALPIRGAYEFDVLHPWTDANLVKIAGKIAAHKSISVDNSFTMTKEQLTEPVKRLVRTCLNQD